MIGLALLAFTATVLLFAAAWALLVIGVSAVLERLQ